jgi:hypothetical protein
MTNIKDNRISVRGISPLGDEMCRVINPISETSKYIICKRANGEEIVCEYSLGSWKALSLCDLISKINFLQKTISCKNDDKY